MRHLANPRLYDWRKEEMLGISNPSLPVNPTLHEVVRESLRVMVFYAVFEVSAALCETRRV
jgi:hypothetical protein